MTVSAGIHASAGGQPVLSMIQAKGAVKTSGSGWAGLAQSNSSSSVAGVPGSFLSNWQAQLASLGSGSEGLGDLKAEPDSSNELEDVAEAPIHQSAPGASQASAPVSPWSALPLKTGISQAGAQAANAAPWLSAQMPRQSAPYVPVVITTPSRASQSSSILPEHSTTATSKLGRTAWGAEPPRQIPVTAMIPPAAFAVPIVAIPIKNSTTLQAEPSAEPAYSEPLANYSANELNEALATSASSFQAPDRTTVAQIQVPEQTQSRDIKVKQPDAVGVVSSTGAAIEDTTQHGSQQSATLVVEVSSPSAWPVAKTEIVPESGPQTLRIPQLVNAQAASTQPLETNDPVRPAPGVRIAPAMSDAADAFIPSAVQGPAKTLALQADDGVSDARITSIPAAVNTEVLSRSGNVSRSPLNSASPVVEMSNPTTSRIQLPAGNPAPSAYSTAPNATDATAGPKRSIEIPNAQNDLKAIPSIQLRDPMPEAELPTSVGKTEAIDVHEMAVYSPHPEGPEQAAAGPNADLKQAQEPATPVRGVARNAPEATSPVSGTELGPESRPQPRTDSGAGTGANPPVIGASQTTAGHSGEMEPFIRAEVAANAAAPAFVSVPAPTGTLADAVPASQSALIPQAPPAEMQTSSMSESVLPGPALAPIPPYAIAGAQQVLQAHAAIAPNTPVAVAVAVSENAVSTTNRPVAAQVEQKTTRGSVGDSRRTLSNQIGPALVTGEPSAVAHVSAVVASVVPAVAISVGGHAQASAPMTPREAFAALDAEAAPGKPTWTHTTPQQAEAGFQDPVLGWVGVRADMSGGGVHAALLPGSAQAAQDLGKHMDGLNNYLAEQHTQVDSLVISAPVGRTEHAIASESSRNGMQQGMGQGMDQGANQGTNQGNAQHSPQQAYSEPDSSISLRMTSADGPSPLRTSAATVENGDSGQGSEGTHISVVA